jgi:hypothetical protein
LSSKQSDQQTADYVAMRDCGTGDCKIVFRTAPSQCGAIAIVAEVTGPNPAWGAGKHGNRAQAEFAAMTNCQKHTRGQCTVRATVCN